MDYRLEVIGIPVSDVDAAKAFYSDVVGFHVDHDIAPGPGARRAATRQLSLLDRMGRAGRSVNPARPRRQLWSRHRPPGPSAGRGLGSPRSATGPEGAPGYSFAFFATGRQRVVGQDSALIAGASAKLCSMGLVRRDGAKATDRHHLMLCADRRPRGAASCWILHGRITTGFSWG